MHEHRLATTSASQIVITSENKPKFSADRGAEEAVGEEQLVVGVPGLGGDAQVKEADPGLQLAVEIHCLRG